jgi:hypothetical protein
VYQVRLIDEKGKELATLQCDAIEPMKQLINDTLDAKHQLENLGLPLTIEPHDKPSSSLLSNYGEQEISMKGMVNLLVLLLLCYHIRMIIQSLEERDFEIRKMLIEVWNSEEAYVFTNNQTIWAIFGLLGFPLTSYGIEKLTTIKGVPEIAIQALIIALLCAHLAYPLVMISWINSHFMMALYFMMFTCGQILKLFSFHHVMHDNRKLLQRIEKYTTTQKTKPSLANLSTYFNVKEDQMEMALEYPQNI